MNKMEIKIRKRLTFHCIYHLHFQVQLELEQSVTTSGGASDQQMFTFYYQPSRSRRKQTGKMESLLQTISMSGTARASQDWFPIYRFVVMILFKLADSISDIIKISQRRLCIQQPASELTYNWDGGWLQDCNMIIFQTQEASSPLIGFIYASRFHLPIALPLASNNFLRSQFSNCQFWHLNLDRI